jgi:threonine/homoserine/homoserine lactone efflux protein
MATSALLFNGLKWAGAAFLVYLGVKMIVARRPAVAQGVSPAAAAPTGAGHRSLFVRGFVSQIANPKAVIFYTALFPQFLTPGGSVVIESALLASTEVVVEFVALLGYAALAAQGSRLGPRFATVTDKVSGGLLVGAGIGLAALRRS